MKKNIFIILITILLLLILLYLYDKKLDILNKEYLDKSNNIYIEYPLFNDFDIDKYFYEYLNKYIDNKDAGSYLFIDYDILEMKERKYQLTMYFYEEIGPIVRNGEKCFQIDVNLSKVESSSVTKKDSFCYNNNSKMIDLERPMIALTFDDGPNHNTTKILDVLEKYGIKATFFILGSNIEGDEEIIKRMDTLGHEIGNHTYNHKLLTKLSDEEITSEIEKTDNEIYQIINKYPTLIRPSYGSYNKKIKSILKRPIITWSIDTLDWKYHNSKKIYERVMKDISDGDIILMHDIYNATLNSLDLIIPKLLKMNYQFVTVSDLLYYKGVLIKEKGVYSSAK